MLFLSRGLIIRLIMEKIKAFFLLFVLTWNGREGVLAMQGDHINWSDSFLSISHMPISLFITRSNGVIQWEAEWPFKPQNCSSIAYLRNVWNETNQLKKNWFDLPYLAAAYHPLTYKQIHIPTVVQGGRGEGWLDPFGFRCNKTYQKDLRLVDKSEHALQDEVCCCVVVVACDVIWHHITL